MTTADNVTTETKYTPGPWRIEAVGSNNYRRIFGPSGELVGHAWSVCGDDLTDGAMKANANLIAAAPDLLAACNALSRLAVMRECCCANLSADYITEHGTRCGVCLMRDAINKALTR